MNRFQFVIAFLAICSTTGWAEVARIADLDISRVQLSQDTPLQYQPLMGPPPVEPAQLPPMAMRGKKLEHGLRARAPHRLIVDVSGTATKFTASVGFDDASRKGERLPTAIFQVVGDGKLLYESGLIGRDAAPKMVEVDLRGVKRLELIARNGLFRGGLVDWGLAEITYEGAKPQAVEPPAVEQYGILTPAAPAAPRINGGGAYGARPGAPFFYAVPATGERPMAFAAEGLPEGLSIDAKTGWITGKASKAGTYAVTLRASNTRGEAQRKWRLVIGPEMCLTPAMGWTAWNAYGTAIDDRKIRAAADALVNTGLVNHGWAYVNVDDGWERRDDTKNAAFGPPLRDEQGRLRPNANFPDMKSLGDYIHARGLKFGIYSGPGPSTCAGFAGSFEHEEIDAKTWAQWGVDYLKYDGVGHPGLKAGATTQEALAYYQRAFRSMRKALDATGRDIVLAICQYGMGDVHKWGKEAGGQSWRTTSDLFDDWGHVCRIGMQYHTKSTAYASPGGWNDPDMLVVGWMGWGPEQHAPRMTPNEQYWHISLWCLLSAPLLLSCDPAKLDDFTLNLLSNDEVLAVNQDTLGKQAGPVDEEQWVWAKPLEDGSWAVGLFNRDDFDAKEVTLKWDHLKIAGRQRVRDIWRQKDLGVYEGKFSAKLPPHAMTLIKVWPE